MRSISLGSRRGARVTRLDDRAWTLSARYLAALAAGFLVAAQLACGGGDRPDREPARGDDRVVQAVPTLAVPLARLPYMGVSCNGRPNWIGCDRVGLYVYLDRHVAGLSASIEGREVPMRPARGGPDARHNWEGFLRPAGLMTVR